MFCYEVDFTFVFKVKKSSVCPFCFLIYYIKNDKRVIETFAKSHAIKKDLGQVPSVI